MLRWLWRTAVWMTTRAIVTAVIGYGITYLIVGEHRRFSPAMVYQSGSALRQASDALR